MKSSLIRWLKSSSEYSLKIKLNILASYINKKIFLSFIGIFIVLSIILVVNHIFLLTRESSSLGYINKEFIDLIFYRFIRDLPHITGFSFLTAVIYSLSKLYQNSEAIIFHASGIGLKMVYRMISPFLFFIVLINSIFSIFSTSWAEVNIEKIKNNAQERPDFIFLKHGNFQKFRNEEIVFYSEDKINENGDEFFQNVFISIENKKFIISDKAKKITNNNSVILQLNNGVIYELDTKKAISEFKNNHIVLYENSSEENVNDYKNTAEEFFTVKMLLKNISNTLTILILALAGIVMSKSQPRLEKNFSLLFGVVFYIIYFNINEYKFYELSQSIFLSFLLFFFPHFFMSFIIMLKNKFSF